MLYGCEAWSLTLREECRIRVFENRRLHNEGLHSLYRSPNTVRVIKSRKLRWTGHVARMEEGRSSFKILTVIHGEKIPLGRPRNWVDLAQVRDYWNALVNMALNLWVSYARELVSWLGFRFT